MLAAFWRGNRKQPEKLNWWEKEFDEKERKVIDETFQPLGNIAAEQLACSYDPNSIGSLCGHLKKEHLRYLGYRLIQRADSLVNENVPVTSMHYYWQSRGEFFYRWRDLDDFALDEAVKSFQMQIGMARNALRYFEESDDWDSLPGHAGYRQLRIIEEKRGNLTLARALCEQAKSEGWADDWDRHIARIDKKLAKISA